MYAICHRCNVKTVNRRPKPIFGLKRTQRSSIGIIFFPLLLLCDTGITAITEVGNVRTGPLGHLRAKWRIHDSPWVEIC